MKNRFVLSIIIFLLYINILPTTAQENAENKTTTIEELSSKVDGIDENVTTLLSDVAGLKKLKISGYLQVQFEKSEAAKGIGMSPYDSSNFAQGRFRVRRSRLKFTYDAGLTQFVVQGDFSNEKFELKDAYLNIIDPWTKYFSLTAGVFNRPVYEVEYSSSQRESMERSQIIRTLYPGERDLGAKLTIEPEDLFKLQIAAFNNTFQGDLKQFYPNSNSEPLYYMARITKELFFNDIGLGIDFGAHARLGNVTANTNKVIESENNNTVVDSVSTIKGDKIGRNWFGAEAQIYYDFLGGMKLLGEYITGTNVDELTTADKKPSSIRKRNFSGFYLMLVKNLTAEWQLAAKYDSYNPNTKIAEADINNKSDLATNTIGLGLHNYSFDNVRISLWYVMISSKTKTSVLDSDPKDNFLTLRFQYKF